MVLIRILALFGTAPMFSNRAIPSIVKVWAGAFVAFALFPLVAVQSGEISLDTGSLIVHAFQEFMIGASIGFSLSVLFSGVIYAGDLIGVDIGFSVSSLIDPQNGVSAPVIGQIQYIVAVFVFLILNGHFFLLQALKASYRVVPIAEMKITGGAVGAMVRITGMVFVTAIKIGAPVLIALFLTDVLMGIIARMVPQINVFFVGLPLKIGVGLVMLAVSMPFFVYVFSKLLEVFENDVVELMRVM
ncbi:MAG: flagellar biosynthetic protein FliR [Candidatus Kryptoniota bacterium]